VRIIDEIAAHVRVKARVIDALIGHKPNLSPPPSKLSKTI
jgi:hypothetical protein